MAFLDDLLGSGWLDQLRAYAAKRDPNGKGSADEAGFNGYLPQAPVFDQPQPEQQQPYGNEGPRLGPMQSYAAGGLQYPVIGQPAAQEDLSARGRLSTAPPVGGLPTPPPQAPAPGMFDRFQAAANNMSGRGLITGLMDAAQGFQTGVRTDARGRADQAQVATLKALIDSGVPEPIARAATQNPDILKQIAPEYFGGFKVVKTGNNPITGEQNMMQGPGGKLYPLDKFVQGGGSAAGTGGGVGSSGMLAPGVKQYDSSLSGEDYLGQFAPEVQAAVKAYMNGDVLPSGNPRLQGIANSAKTIAQKYGQDIGQPVSDATYSQMRKFRMELGSGVPSSLGGQAKAFTQATTHLESLSNELEKLNNYDPVGIPKVAAGINYLRQEGNSDQKAISDKAQGIGQALAGEIGKLFSGTQGGGVHERQLTRERFNTISTPKQLAASIEATRELMQGGLSALESRRDAVFGPGGGNSGVKFVDEATQKRLDNIDATAARIKSGTKAPAPAAVVSGPKVGDVQKGYRFKGGNPADPNSWEKP